jgi:FkbM family methyltransferase
MLGRAIDYCRRKATEYRALAEILGWRGMVTYVRRRRQQRDLRDTALRTLRSRDARYPLWFRPHTSDWAVFGQIFLMREYACLTDLPHVGLVLDCGANVGFSAAYFLTRFPTCRVMAVEPDPANFAVLERNLAPYGNRATAIRAGVWSHPTRLTMSEVPYRDGRDWARQVRECRPDEPGGLPAVDIPTLLAESGAERISLLKLDIEGAEAVVFADPTAPWLDKVDTLVIELHDDSSFGECTPVFERAIAGRGFTLSRSVELTVCKRG